MKKISYYLLFIALAGAVLISFGVYQRYFKEKKPNFLLFKVERGSIQEVVKARGEIVPQNDFNLEFPFSGTVEKVFIKEGQQVNQNDPLIKLETTDFELEIKRLEASLAQNQVNLEKLLAGSTPEEIKVSKDNRDAAQDDLNSSYNSAVNTLNDAYTKIYNGYTTATSVQNSYFSALDQEGIKVQNSRTDINNNMQNAKSYLDAAQKNPISENIDSAISQMLLSLNNVYNDLKVIRDQSDQGIYYLKISSTDKALIDTQKGYINTASTNITTSKQSISSYKIALQKTEDELALIKKGPRKEDIKIAEARIEETKIQIAIMEEKIKKSTLYSPISAKVAKIWFEKQELFRPGQPAVTLETSNHKIQADISELEIGKIREVDKSEVSIQLDAFPGLKIKGRIISVEPREIIKEGDKYYRINIFIEPHSLEIRSGMSVDLAILISFKDNVLKIPEFAVYKKNDKKFATVLEGSKQKEVEIETGISGGESIEVIKGLNEGQTVMVSTD